MTAKIDSSHTTPGLHSEANGYHIFANVSILGFSILLLRLIVWWISPGKHVVTETTAPFVRTWRNGMHIRSKTPPCAELSPSKCPWGQRIPGYFWCFNWPVKVFRIHKSRDAFKICIFNSYPSFILFELITAFRGYVLAKEIDLLPLKYISWAIAFAFPIVSYWNKEFSTFQALLCPVLQYILILTEYRFFVTSAAQERIRIRTEIKLVFISMDLLFNNWLTKYLSPILTLIK